MLNLIACVQLCSRGSPRQDADFLIDLGV